MSRATRRRERLHHNRVREQSWRTLLEAHSAEEHEADQVWAALSPLDKWAVLDAMVAE